MANYHPPKQHRLPGYDYSSPGFYFITICTDQRICYFGEVLEGEMFLSEVGQTVQSEILKIEKDFNRILVDQFVIMPNHIHLILHIFHHECGDLINQIPTFKSNILNNPMELKYPTIGYVIRRFKARSKHFIDKHYPNTAFAWQSRFHDHIIRSEKELMAIRHYIRNNPLKWFQDRNNNNDLYI